MSATERDQLSAAEQTLRVLYEASSGHLTRNDYVVMRQR